MERPYIIVNSHVSLDGNMWAMNLREFAVGSQRYQEVSLAPGTQKLDIDGFMNGKKTTEDNITRYARPQVNPDAAEVPPGDFTALPDADMYYISIDARGELAWPINSFPYGGRESHVLEVLTEQADNAYKDFLRRMGISYIIAGTDEIDYDIMLDKLFHLGIERLMVAGGGSLNWSFIQQRLADEIDVVVIPIANGDPNSARFLTAHEPYSSIEPTAFTLRSVEHLGDGVVWMRYVPKQSPVRPPSEPVGK